MSTSTECPTHHWVGACRTLLLGLGLCLGLTAAPVAISFAADAPNVEAVLVFAQGQVVVERAGQAADGAFGQSLHAGDRIIVKDGAKASVMMASGQLLELGAGSSITLGATAEATGSVMAELGGADVASLSQNDAGISALPALRGDNDGDELDVHAVPHTLIRPGRIAFSWNEVPDALEYRLILIGSGDAAGSYRVTGTSWTAPEGTFTTPGEEWAWRVEATTDYGVATSQPFSFRVAEGEAVNAIDKMEQRLDPLLSGDNPDRADAARYLLANQCRALGFNGEALGHLETLADRHRDRKELKRQIAVLRHNTTAEDPPKPN